MIGEHESVQQVRKDIKIVDQSNLHTTLCMQRRTASQNYKIGFANEEIHADPIKG